MINPDTIERIRGANPVPETDLLHPEPDESAALFSSIVRRRDTMLGTKLQRPAPSLPQQRPWYRRPALVFIAAAIVAIAVIVPVAVLGGSGTDVADEPPAPMATTSVPPTTVEAPVPTTAGTPVTTGAPTTVVPATTTPPELPPGYDWSRVELDAGLFPEGADIRGVTRVESVFVAVGRDADDCAQAWLSPDGEVWELASLMGRVGAPCSAELTGVASKGSTVVAIDTGPWDDIGPSLWISENGGFEWSEVPSGEMPFDTDDWLTSIAASDSGFVIGVSGMECSEPECFGTSAIWFSPDGRQWLEAYAPSAGEITDIAAGPDGFVAAASWPAVVLRSADGQAWSVVASLEGLGERDAPCFVAPNAVTHGPSGYVIAGDCVPDEAEDAYSSAWQSDDGVTWTQVPYDGAAFGDPAYITSIAADEQGYVAAGWTLSPTDFPATVWFSAEGSSWTRIELGEGDSSISGVVVHAGTAVAVGGAESGPAVWLGTRR